MVVSKEFGVKRRATIKVLIVLRVGARALDKPRRLQNVSARALDQVAVEVYEFFACDFVASRSLLHDGNIANWLGAFHFGALHFEVSVPLLLTLRLRDIGRARGDETRS